MRIIAAVLYLALCALPSHADVLSDIKDMEKANEKAAENTKVSEEAMRAFPTSDKDRVKYAEALNVKAQGLFRDGNAKEAVAVWERIMVIDPKNMDNIRNVALTYKDLGRNDEAVATMRKALELDPNDDITNYQMAQLATNPDEAIKYLGRACELDPKAVSHGLVGHLAAFLMNAQRYEEAETEFAKIFDAKEESAPDMLNFGDMMIKLGRIGEAVRTFKKLVKMLDEPTGSTKELPEYILKDFKTKANLALSKISKTRASKRAVEVGADGSSSGGGAATEDELTVDEDEDEDEDEDGTADELKYAKAAVKIAPKDVDARIALAQALDRHAPDEEREAAAGAVYDEALVLAKEQLAPLLAKMADPDQGYEALTMREQQQLLGVSIGMAQRRSYAREQNRRVNQGKAPELYADESGFTVRSGAASGWAGGRRASAAALGPGTCSIPRRDAATLSVSEFHTQYVDAGKPLLLYGEGVVAGKAWQKWTKPGFLTAYGEATVIAVGSAGVVADQTLGNPNAPGRLNLSLADYVANFTGHADEAAFSNPPYLFKQRQLAGVAGDVAPPKYFEPLLDADAGAAEGGDGSSARFGWSAERRANASLFFVGPTHSGAYFHAHYAAWNAVVYGRKRWLLLPPGAYYGKVHNGNLTMVQWVEQYLDAVKPLDCVQEAGTMLYIPEGWTHATINLDDTIGIAFEVGPGAFN